MADLEMGDVESALDALLGRHSTPSRNLGLPGPDEAQLRTLLQAAVQIPDHGRLTPWRFVRIAGDVRARFGQRLAELAATRGIDPAKVEKERLRYLDAPLIIAVVARIVAGHKIPEREQLLSAGCACFNLLHAAQALGFGAQWLTGWAAYDAEVARWFGLADGESIVGFVHIGTAREPVPDRERPDPMSRLSELAL
jgi:nitroreductase